MQRMTDYPVSPDGQPLTFPPLGNINAEPQYQDWYEQDQGWQNQGGSFPIAQLTVGKSKKVEEKDDFVTVTKPKRKYVKTSMCNQTLHEGTRHTNRGCRFRGLETVDENLAQEDVQNVPVLRPVGRSGKPKDGK